MMTATNTHSADASPRSSKLLMGLLAGSLALNLLGLGFLIGVKLRDGPPPGAMLHNSAFSVGRAVRQFDDERRDALWPVVKPHFRELRGEIKNLRRAQHRWETAYGADQVDFAALDTSHAELSERVSSIQQMNFTALRALAAELTPQERAQLLGALRQPRGHRPGHRGKHPDNHRVQ